MDSSLNLFGNDLGSSLFDSNLAFGSHGSNLLDNRSYDSLFYNLGCRSFDLGTFLGFSLTADATNHCHSGNDKHKGYNFFHDKFI